MAELIHGAEGGRVQGIQTLEQEKGQNYLFVLAKHLIGALRTIRWKGTDEPDAQSAHRKDESDNQLWKSYHQQEFNNPRPPMDFIR